MSTTKNQFRGHCQQCGRQQAVTRGRIAAHGYDVQHGYFRGVCGGHRYAPIEWRRTEADVFIESARRDAADQREHAEALRAGTVTPARAKTGQREHKPLIGWTDVTVPFAEASGHYQRAAVIEAIAAADSRARGGDRYADGLARLCDAFHGQPLIQAQRAEAPAAILCGDTRSFPNGRTGTVTRVNGAAVYWTDSSGFRGKSASRTWRALPTVSAPDELSGEHFEPVADPDAWKLADDAIVAARRSRTA